MATPMMEQYHRVKRDHVDDIVLIRMGDFFEMFHDDAIEGSSILGITLTKRNHGKGEGSNVPLAGFPHHQLEPYLNRLTRAGKRVVVVEQIEDPKQAKGLVKRDIVRIVTAGTNLSEEALDADSNQFLAAVFNDSTGYGLAVCDVTTGEFAVATLSREEIKERLNQLRPTEIIYNEDQKADTIDLVTFDVMFTPIAPWIFDFEFAKDTLYGHFKVQSLKGFGIDGDLPSISSAGAALYYIKENLRTDPEHIGGLTQLPTTDFLHIDSATRRNLELIEPAWGADSSTTLFSHLDRTVTPFGRRLFKQQLLRPLLDRDQIEKRLDAVQEFIESKSIRSDLRDLLRSLGDIERLTARLATGRGSPRDVGGLRHALYKVPEISTALEGMKSDLVSFNAGHLDPQEELTLLLVDAIVDEPPSNMMKGGAIRSGYNERLDEVRMIARGGKDYILARQEEERIRTGINSLTIGYNKVFGYYIEITKVHQDKVPEDYIRKQTLVNAERYITPDLKEWEEKILTAEEEALALERDLFEEVRLEIASRAAIIQENARCLADLDTLSAAAELAVNQKYNRPVIRPNGRLKLIHSRHPVIENLLPPGESFVANDLDIGTDGRQIALVTGPNMGGKSTYLRQVGLIVLMAHMGLFVPARDAEIPLTDRVFTRVGASDNIAGGESTFLVEMHEAANILHNATGKSLILLDEIGRGTSTFDGLSLAWSIVEYLHDMPGDAHPKTLFATHYHELTELEKVLEGVFNLHVQVKEWGEKVVFLRKVISGRSGASYGIQVARLAGLPQKIIDRAKDVLATLEANEITDENMPRLAEGAKIRKIKVPPKDPLQVSLFTVEERAVRDELAKADLDNMTPLEALRLLADMKDKYGTTDESVEETDGPSDGDES